MAQTYLHRMFGPGACALQTAAGSRTAHARMEGRAGAIDTLTAKEFDFIVARGSEYIVPANEAQAPRQTDRGAMHILPSEPDHPG